MTLDIGQEDPLEKKMAIHSSTLAREVPWTEETGGLQSTGMQDRHELVTKPPPPPWFFLNIILNTFYTNKYVTKRYLKYV